MAAESKSVALEGLCKMSMDTPFALRGYLAGANSKYQMMGGLQSSRFSSGPSIVGPTKLSAGLCGSRALHGSQLGQSPVTACGNLRDHDLVLSLERMRILKKKQKTDPPS
ncbi:uncharacterized protein A4U43_C07F38770 [Asparagus officinalis]|uniref:Uncharacterized protein n=1 Tax=Asparagus officinalis TaxID=4686 RepID=A0A5P1EI77_ASPOF|nr:uncharacterized protein A4U43_C07F38770 [Asparagus officinalis]